MSMILDVGEIKTLKQIVFESGLTRQQLADILGVAPPRVTKIMQPGQDLRISTAVKLAKALNVSLKTLIASLGVDVADLPDDAGGEQNN
jgi:transcriptional regulator with XRE-family HTH domain